MGLSKCNQGVLEAFNRGYRIDEAGNVFNASGNLLSGHSSGGYKKISFRINKHYHTVLFHRLQAFVKFGELIFESNIQVRHLNGNSFDNSFENIGIGTPSQNMMDKSEEVRMRCSLIATRKMQDSIRSLESRKSIYLDLYNGISYSKIIKKHKGLSKSTLSFMKNKSAEYFNFIEKISARF